MKADTNKESNPAAYHGEEKKMYLWLYGFCCPRLQPIACPKILCCVAKQRGSMQYIFFLFLIRAQLHLIAELVFIALQNYITYRYIYIYIANIMVLWLKVNIYTFNCFRACSHLIFLAIIHIDPSASDNSSHKFDAINFFKSFFW